MRALLSFLLLAGPLSWGAMALDLPQVTGSNYVMWSIGDYVKNPTEENWYKPGTLKPLMASYHLSPETVQKQLSVMKSNGQKKISLVYWYVPVAAPNSSIVFNGHHVYSEKGEIHPQIKNNIALLAADIAKNGFESVTVRMGPQGMAAADQWKKWEEGYYQTHWNLLKNLRTEFQNGFKNTKVKILFDLAGEQGGLEKGMSLAFCQRLWTDYVKEFGVSDTVGFSVAFLVSRVRNLLKIYDSVKAYPVAIALDIYGNEYNQLRDLYEEVLQSRGNSIPLVIMESFYRDKNTVRQIQLAARDYQLNITDIYQWPLMRGGPPHFSMDYPQ